MRQKRRFAAGLLAACLALGLCACGGGEAGPTPTPEAVPTPGAEPTASPSPAPDGEDAGLRVALTAGPASLDPMDAARYQDVTVFSLVYEGLMSWADSGDEVADGVGAGELVCGAAERYEKTAHADGTATYTFYLRPEAKWSDGKPVTAQDFAYGWHRLFHGAEGAALLECIVNAPDILAGAKEPTDLATEVVDDTTFAVTVRDVPWFLELCALPCTAPVRQDVAEQSAEWSYDAQTCVTNGPYRLRSWESQGMLTLERNEYYRAPNPDGPDAVTLYFEDDTAGLASAFAQGAVDAAVGVDAEGAVRVPTLTSYYLTFQTQRAPFDDARVRRAFSLAVDRAALATQTVPGQTPAGGLVPEGVAGDDAADFRTGAGDYIDPSEQAYEANCEKARTLLQEAGYPGGAGLDEVEYLYPDSATHRAVALALQACWQEQLGVTVTLRAEKWSDFLSACTQGDFAIARGRWAADYNDAGTFLALWQTGAAGNYGGCAEPRFDALMAQADATSGAKRTDALRRAEAILVDELSALAPVYYENRPCLLSEHLTGVYCSPLGAFFFTACAVE